MVEFFFYFRYYPDITIERLFKYWRRLGEIPAVGNKRKSPDGPFCPSVNETTYNKERFV